MTEPGESLTRFTGLRFRTAARAAGVEGRVTAHTGRIGLASTGRAASTRDVWLDGNWQTGRIVATTPPVFV